MQWMGGFPNLKFGIANLINRPNVIDLLESGRSLPLDKMVLETDCPWARARWPLKTASYSCPCSEKLQGA
jgi:Tat protein secretion system quality control protein TatD with DNase activity